MLKVIYKHFAKKKVIKNGEIRYQDFITEWVNYFLNFVIPLLRYDTHQVEQDLFYGLILIV